MVQAATTVATNAKKPSMTPLLLLLTLFSLKAAITTTTTTMTAEETPPAPLSLSQLIVLDVLSFQVQLYSNEMEEFLYSRLAVVATVALLIADVIFSTRDVHGSDETGFDVTQVRPEIYTRPIC
ncbi:uncharacterized protein DS421_11g341040 [Arachis hypogaea]|nr:uncharacterized protein DS421_11g341040 [Arachis hypogaea]